MTHRLFLAVTLAGVALGSPAAAQNRTEQQLFLEIRTLQSQVQQLTLALNTVAEQIKKTDAKVEANEGAAAKRYADQKELINGINAQQRTLNERESESAVRVLQLSQEVKSIREGLALQQTLLNEILARLDTPMTAPPGDPSEPPQTTPPPTPPTNPPAGPPAGRAGSSIPPSPTAYYNAAFGYFYNGKYDAAIEALSEALKRFPEFPEAGRAQLAIGESQEALGGHDQDALDAYGLVIKNYKDPDFVSEALYKQGLVYERLGQKEAALKALNDCVSRFPSSASAIMAAQAIKRIGGRSGTP